MRLLKVEPVIYKYKDCNDFCEAFRIGKDDLIITSQNVYCEFLKDNIKESAVILTENYGTGYPSDEMVKSIYESIKRISYERVIAIGNADVLQIGKIFSLKNICPVNDLFERNLEISKEKELVLVPAVLGYTSEMTNICTLDFSNENSAKQLIEDELYADSTILIPQLLKLLSFKSFISSSINLFMQAVWLYASLKSIDYVRLFSEKSIRIILNGYKKLETEGKESYADLFEEFLLASNYINVAYSNINPKLIKKCNITCDFSQIQEGQGYRYFSDYLKQCLNGDMDEDTLKFSDLMSRALECDKNNIYNTFIRILNNIMPEISLL